jgi:hypothetical protein
MLVTPGQVWAWLAEAPKFWPAIMWQLGALAIGRAISVHAMIDLDAAVKQSAPQNSTTSLWFCVSLLIMALMLFAGNLLFALALKAVTAAVGAAISWRQAMVLAVFALLPAILGDTLSRISMGVIRPLSTDMAGVWAAHLRPFSLGLATFIPQRFASLSLPWHFAAFVDVFAVWSLLCLWLGLKRFAGFNSLRASWVILGVMLILALVLAAIWQAGQIALLHVTH